MQADWKVQKLCRFVALNRVHRLPDEPGALRQQRPQGRASERCLHPRRQCHREARWRTRPMGSRETGTVGRENRPYCPSME